VNVQFYSFVQKTVHKFIIGYVFWPVFGQLGQRNCVGAWHDIYIAAAFRKIISKSQVETHGRASLLGTEA